jgi:hypothetical protein
MKEEGGSSTTVIVGSLQKQEEAAPQRCYKERLPVLLQEADVASSGCNSCCKGMQDCCKPRAQLVAEKLICYAEVL